MGTISNMNTLADVQKGQVLRIEKRFKKVSEGSHQPKSSGSHALHIPSDGLMWFQGTEMFGVYALILYLNLTMQELLYMWRITSSRNMPLYKM